MNTHELAHKLLELPDMPVATCDAGIPFSSLRDPPSMGPLRIAEFTVGLTAEPLRHIVIGCLLNAHNPPNFSVGKILYEEPRAATLAQALAEEIIRRSK